MQLNLASPEIERAQPWYVGRAHQVVVLLSMATFMALASLHIGAKGFWLDEVYSVTTALDWGQMWDRLLHYEANMWLYYLLLHFWLKLGHSEVMIRGLSVLAGVATIPVVYLLAKRLAGSRAGAMAALLMATNVFFLRHAQEARAYSLAVFLVTGSTYLFVRGMEGASGRYWLGFVLCAVTAIYAHFFGGLVLLVQAISVGFFPRRRTPWRSLAASACGVALLLVLIPLFQPLNSGQVDWLSKPAAGQVPILFTRLAGSRPLLAVYAVLCAIALASALRRMRQDTGTLVGWRHMLVLLWLVIPPLATFVLSLLVKPIWVKRYLVICVPPLILLGSSGLSRLRRPWLRAAVVCVMLLLSGRCLAWFYREIPYEDWRALVRFVLSEAHKGEPVLFYAYHTRQPFEYYYNRLAENQAMLNRCELAPEPYRPGGGTRCPDPDVTLLREITREHKRAWLVLGYCWNKALGRDSQRKMVESVMSETHTASIERRFAYVIVRLYERVSDTSVGTSSPGRERFSMPEQPVLADGS